MHIELRLLRSFVAVYETGSMSRAAVRSFCSQAAMSMRLKLLEDEIGHQLFIRHHHRLEATALGSEFYAKALAVLASYDELVSATRSRDVVQKVRIGVPDDYALSFVARILHAVSLQIKGFEIEIICDLSSNLVAAVQRQDIDLALATVVFAPPNAILISQTDLLWTYHPGWRPDNSAPIPLAVYPEGCVFRKAMITCLGETETAWRIVAQSRSHAGVLAAVRGGIAITAMADGTAPDDLTTIISSSILPPLNRVPIYLLKRPGDPSKAMASLEQKIIDQVSLAAKVA
jgi:DNA-binding transcriptional LysR family regulator